MCECPCGEVTVDSALRVGGGVLAIELYPGCESCDTGPAVSLHFFDDAGCREYGVPEPGDAIRPDQYGGNQGRGWSYTLFEPADLAAAAKEYAEENEIDPAEYDAKGFMQEHGAAIVRAAIRRCRKRMAEKRKAEKEATMPGTLETDPTAALVTPLWDWAAAHCPKEHFIWTDAFWYQLNFVRNALCPLIAQAEGAKANPVRVIGEHTSKSIVLPVYQIATENLTVTMRCNMHDWNVSVRGKGRLAKGWHRGIISSVSRQYLNFEGFPDDLRYPPYEDRDQEDYAFSFSVVSTYQLYALFVLLLPPRDQEPSHGA